MPWSSWTTMSPRAQVGERAQRAAAADARGRAAAGRGGGEKAVLGEDREPQRRRDEAVAQARLRRSVSPRSCGARLPSLEPAGAQAREVVGGALALAAPRPGRRRCGSPSARASRAPASASRERARGAAGGLGAELDRRVAGDRVQAHARALGERGLDLARAGRRGGARRRRGRPRRRPASGRQRRPDLLVAATRPAASAGRGRAARGSARPAAARRCRGAPRPGRRDLRQLAVLGASSAAGAISTASASPSERCVNVENQRSDSISMSNRSTRTARSSVAG